MGLNTKKFKPLNRIILFTATHVSILLLTVVIVLHTSSSQSGHAISYSKTRELNFYNGSNALLDSHSENLSA